MIRIGIYCTQRTYQYVHCCCYAATWLCFRCYSYNTQIIHCSACIVICIGIIAFNTREEVASTNDLLLHQPILIHSINKTGLLFGWLSRSWKLGCLQLNNTAGGNSYLLKTENQKCEESPAGFWPQPTSSRRIFSGFTQKI
jgi:hypothetical protein